MVSKRRTTWTDSELDANNKSPDVAGPELEDINQLQVENNFQADKFQVRSTTTIATRAVDVGRIATNTSPTRWSRAVTVSRMPSSFVSLDFEAIRQGFLEGGVKSTDGNSTNSMSSRLLKLQHLISNDIH